MKNMIINHGFKVEESIQLEKAQETDLVQEMYQDLVPITPNN